MYILRRRKRSRRKCVSFEVLQASFQCFRLKNKVYNSYTPQSVYSTLKQSLTSSSSGLDVDQKFRKGKRYIPP